MNIFTKLFGRNGSTANSDMSVLNMGTENELPGNGFKELFTDENPPDKEFEASRENVLKIFMEQNFLSHGFNDGYEFHSTQSYERGIEKIRAEYQHLLEIIEDEKDSEIYSLNIHRMQCEGMPGNIIDQINYRIENLKVVKDKFGQEHELSKNFKGHLEFPVSKYRDGFEKGQSQYFNEKFFANSTGLFG